MKFKVNIINLGRDKINDEFEIEGEDINEISNVVFYTKINHSLVSSNVTMEPVEEDEELYSVYAGFRKVGEVRIKKIK